MWILVSVLFSIYEGYFHIRVSLLQVLEKNITPYEVSAFINKSDGKTELTGKRVGKRETY